MKENMTKLRKNSRTPFPNYTGARIEMTYPLNPSLARSILLLHKPWTKPIPTAGKTNEAIITDCIAFLNSTSCPLGIKYMFQKEKARYKSRKYNAEPSSKHNKDNNNHETATQYDPDIVELVENVSTIVGPIATMNKDLAGFNFGFDHGWSSCSNPIPTLLSKHEISTWLENQIEKQYKKTHDLNDLCLPLKSNGTACKIEECLSDQYTIIHCICQHLKKNVLSKCTSKQPQLLMTIRGKAGTGKSMMINTLQ